MISHRDIWTSGLTTLLLSSLISCRDSAPDSLSQPSAIYGADTRMEFTDHRVTKMAHDKSRSVAILVDTENMKDAGDGKQRLISKVYGEKHQLCTNERFWKQPTVGFCTAFLIGKDRLATAGHCLETDVDCSSTEVVFDFAYRKGVKDPTLVPNENVYHCKRILARELDKATGTDFAVIELDRPVTDRRPLAFRTEGVISRQDRVAVIGHPKGLPMKIDAGALVTGASEDFAFFRAAVDVSRGNSGSPVFNNRTGVVEGILVRGIGDFYFDQKADCSRSFQCKDLKACRGEEITRSNFLKGLEQ